MRKTDWVATATLAAILLWNGSSSAHKPVVIGGTFDGPAAAVTLRDPDVSQVVYADLPAARPSLWVAVEAAAGRDLYVQLGAPALERLRAFRPQMAILGPGLPELPLPLPAPPGVGAVLVVTSSIADGLFFHEPFTDTDSWVVGEQILHVPLTGTYYVVVWSSSLLDGKVWVAIGEREEFGWSDILSAPRTINAVRAFHEAGRDPRLIVAAKLLFLAGAGLLIACLTQL